MEINQDDGGHIGSGETYRKNDDVEKNMASDDDYDANYREKCWSRVDWTELEACVECDGLGNYWLAI